MTRRSLAAILLAGLALTGCGSTAGPAVATAEQPSAPASPSVSSSVSVRVETDFDKALRYTRCMTENGFVMSDPVEGQILVTYNVIPFDVPPEQAATRMSAGIAAHARCKQFLPATWPVKIDAKEIARSRAYVECMRQRGIDEPVAGADGMIREPTDDDWRRTPEYQAAVAKCRHLVDDPANDQPENR